MFERIEITEGDIAKIRVDAIVNAANRTLLGGGGVDGAIHRAAGPELKEHCRSLGGCKTGDAKITPGFRLPAKHVIHTVGPVYASGTRGEPEGLASCYRRSLEVARENHCRSIAFPSISTGAYHYPFEDASRIAITVALEFLRQNVLPEKATFVLFGERDYDAFLKVYESVKAEGVPGETT